MPIRDSVKRTMVKKFNVIGKIQEKNLTEERVDELFIGIAHHEVRSHLRRWMRSADLGMRKSVKYVVDGKEYKSWIECIQIPPSWKCVKCGSGSNRTYQDQNGQHCSICWDEMYPPQIVPGLVEVDGSYAYRTRVKDLAIGDVVLVPATWLDKIKGRHDPKEATVTSLTSTYTGETSCILGILRKADKSVVK